MSPDVSRFNKTLERVIVSGPLLLAFILRYYQSETHLPYLLIVLPFILPLGDNSSSLSTGLLACMSMLVTLSWYERNDCPYILFALLMEYCLILFIKDLTIKNMTRVIVIVDMMLLQFPHYIILSNVVILIMSLCCKPLLAYHIKDLEQVVLSWLYSVICSLSVETYRTGLLIASDEPLTVAVVGLFHSINLCLLLLIIRRLLNMINFKQSPAVEIIMPSIYIAYIVFPHLSLCLQANPVQWILAFIHNKSHRGTVLLYWGCMLTAGIWMIVRVAQSKTIPTVIVRKLFHFLACVMFAPMICLDPDLMILSFGVAVSVLLILDCIRCIFPTSSLHAFYKLFVEAHGREFSLHHLHLLIGCALPLILHRVSPRSNSLPYAGIITVAIGDAMVSLYTIYPYLNVTRYNIFSRREPLQAQHWEGAVSDGLPPVVRC
jgi:hypothetical protein